MHNRAREVNNAKAFIRALQYIVGLDEYITEDAWSLADRFRMQPMICIVHSLPV